MAKSCDGVCVDVDAKFNAHKNRMRAELMQVLMVNKNNFSHYKPKTEYFLIASFIGHKHKLSRTYGTKSDTIDNACNAHTKRRLPRVHRRQARRLKPMRA